jgi:hypothetical protein
MLAERAADLARAAELRYGVLPPLRQALAEADASLAAGARLVRQEVGADEVATWWHDGLASPWHG